MAKQRTVKTSFWSDQYIEGLNTDAKLLFLYLLTNDSANLIGIYELSIRRITFETGLTKEKILDILETLENDEKVLYLDNRVIFKSYIKHQMSTPSIVQGMMRERGLIPIKIIDIINDHPRLGGVGSTLLNLTLLNFTLPKGIDGFDKFRSIYPRKESKGNAEKAFAKALALTDLDTILAGVEKYCVHIRRSKTEKQFIKHPATWLNQKCYSDDYKSGVVVQTTKPIFERVLEEKTPQTEAEKLAIQKRLSEVKSGFMSKVS